MPIIEKGKKIKKAMIKEYGSEKGKKVFYASENKGIIKGIKRYSQIAAIKRKTK